MTWKSKLGEIYSHNDLPDECTHIVYKVHFTDGTKYVGYKTVRSERLTPALASGKVRDGARRVNKDVLKKEDGSIATTKKEKKDCRSKGIKAKRTAYDMVLKDLPFKSYTGSSEENDGKVTRYKEILHFCSNKRTATYLETQLLFEVNALTNEWYNNKNIGGKYFDNCLDGFIS